MAEQYRQADGPGGFDHFVPLTPKKAHCFEDRVVIDGEDVAYMLTNELEIRMSQRGA